MIYNWSHECAKQENRAIRTQEGHPVPSWEKGKLSEGSDGLADTEG